MVGWTGGIVGSVRSGSGSVASPASGVERRAVAPRPAHDRYASPRTNATAGPPRRRATSTYDRGEGRRVSAAPHAIDRAGGPPPPRCRRRQRHSSSLEFLGSRRSGRLGLGERRRPARACRRVSREVRRERLTRPPSRPFGRHGVAAAGGLVRRRPQRRSTAAQCRVRRTNPRRGAPASRRPSARRAGSRVERPRVRATSPARAAPTRGPWAGRRASSGPAAGRTRRGARPPPAACRRRPHRSSPSASVSARPISRRASVGRPRAAAASAATTRAISGPSSPSRLATAASPAPARSPVRQRASARSSRPSDVELVASGQGLELGPGERQ